MAAGPARRPDGLESPHRPVRGEERALAGRPSVALSPLSGSCRLWDPPGNKTIVACTELPVWSKRHVAVGQTGARGPRRGSPTLSAHREGFSEEETLGRETGGAKSRGGRDRGCSEIPGPSSSKAVWQETGLAPGLRTVGAIWPIWVWTRCDLQLGTGASAGLEGGARGLAAIFR